MSSTRTDRRPRGKVESFSPYGERARERTTNSRDAVPTLIDDFIKVAKESNPKAVAGRIAHVSRAGDPPKAILSTGGQCVNQAIKALCIAREYLVDDGIDVAFQPAFLDSDRSKPALALYLAKHAPTRLADAEIEFAVSGHSNPQSVAGALAARIREGKTVSLSAIGVDAVANAVLAIGNARVYLEADKMDVRVFPSFFKVNKDGMNLSAIRMQIIAENI